MIGPITDIINYLSGPWPAMQTISIASIIIGASGAIYVYFYNKKLLKKHLLEEERKAKGQDVNVSYNTLDKYVNNQDGKHP